MNAKKSKNLYFGLQKPPPICLELGGVIIPWEDSWDYFGVTLRSGKVFDCCVKQKLARNSMALLISFFAWKVDLMVLLRLWEARCLAFLTYVQWNFAPRDFMRQA